MRITLVRHGETTGGSSIRYSGATDVPLSELGREQMRRAGRALAGERFDAVFSSRLSRSREGAALIAPRAVIVAMAMFDEVNFGRWEGWTREEIEQRDPENFRRWRESKGWFTYPEGESRVDFHARVRRGLTAILTDYRAGHLLMVLHRGVIASILGELLALSNEQRLALEIDLGSIHVVTKVNGGKWIAPVFNRLPE